MNLSNRKNIRIPNFDYGQNGAYFITICVKDRKPILSDIVEDEIPNVKLTKFGEIADKYIKKLSDFYDHLSVESYVIMPNHIHILLFIRKNIHTLENGQSGTPVPTNVERANSICSQFVSTFKRFCNKEYGENIWQARFNDHIIRNREDYEEHLKYIYENPMCWCYDELYADI